MRFGSQLEISLQTLDSNFHKLKGICKSNEVLFMVKADAYGHGLVPITSFCHQELGIREFGCASLGEAMTLRGELPKSKFEIYVFSDVNLKNEDLIEFYSDNRIIPVISSEENLEIFLSRSEFKNAPLALKFNTGMNRLGIEVSRVDEVIKTLRKNGRNTINHLMTHLACASLSMNNKKNKEQFNAFNEIKNTFKSSGVNVEKTSIANSGAIEQGAGLDETHVRPGLMMYGPSSLIPSLSDSSLWEGELISKLTTKILKVFPIKKGTPIGYGASACPDNGQIIIIALGYGDGFGTANQGSELSFKQNNYKVVGRVNMDMSQLLLASDVPAVQQGDDFVVWDKGTSNFLSICQRSKMIPYEVFTSITSRIPKLYI